MRSIQGRMGQEGDEENKVRFMRIEKRRERKSGFKQRSSKKVGGWEKQKERNGTNISN